MIDQEEIKIGGLYKLKSSIFMYSSKYPLTKTTITHYPDKVALLLNEIPWKDEHHNNAYVFHFNGSQFWVVMPKTNLKFYFERIL